MHYWPRLKQSSGTIISYDLENYTCGQFHTYFTRDVFYVRREVNLMKTAKVNAYIMFIFGKIELLSIHVS